MVKESACQSRRHKRHGFDPWVRKIPWKRKWQPTPITCLENSMDRAAWRATVNGVTKSWTQLSNTHTHTHNQFSRVRLLATPWTAARQASLSVTNSQSLLKLMSIESVMPSNHLILCHPLLVPPSIFPSIRVFLNESVL